MRVIVALLLVMGLALTALPAFSEDGNNISDQLGDIFSGKGNTYVGVEIIKDIQLKKPIFGMDEIGFKVWSDVLAGKIDDGIQRDIRGGGRVRLIF